MIAAFLFSTLSIYPWNLSTSGYAAEGKYSSGATYWSRSAFVVLDKQNRDLLAVGFDESRITSNVSSYRQKSLLGRTAIAVDQSFRPGILAGWLASNDVDGGQMLGMRIDGENRWVGYSVLYHYGEWTLVDYATGKSSRQPIRQSELNLWRSWNRWWMLGRMQFTQPNNRTLSYVVLTLGATPIPRITLSIDYGIGRSVFPADWNSLTVDNSRDELRNEIKATINGRVIPRTNLSCSYIYKSYRSELSGLSPTTYSLKLWVAGLSYRI